MTEHAEPSETLLIDDEDRYSRLRLIGWWEQEKLAAARVLVVGAGALGNEVLKNLALVGIGVVVVVDFDQIDRSNLARAVLFRASDCGRSKAEVAAEALRDMNPDTAIRPLHANVITEVGLGVFRDVDVVIGCLDNREARLWVNRQCWKVGTPWIDGGIQEINGVVKVFAPPNDACYECAMTENDYRLINLRYSCPLLRQEDLQAGKVPTAPTISSVIGGLQTQEALKLIHGFQVEAGTALVFNGIANHFYKTTFQRQDDCLSHETYPDPVELDEVGHNNTAAELLAALQKRHQLVGQAQIALERELVTELNCRGCAVSKTVLKPRFCVPLVEANCESCGETMEPKLQSWVAADDPLMGKPLSTLSIPPYDIVRVHTDDNEYHCLLAQDRSNAMRSCALWLTGTRAPCITAPPGSRARLHSEVHQRPWKHRVGRCVTEDMGGETRPANPAAVRRSYGQGHST